MVTDSYMNTAMTKHVLYVQWLNDSVQCISNSCPKQYTCTCILL